MAFAWTVADDCKFKSATAMEHSVTKLSNERKPLKSGAGMDRKIESKIPKWVRPAGIAAAMLVFMAVAYFFFAPDGGRTLRLDGSRVTVSEVVTGTFEDFIPVRARVTPLKTLYLDAIEGGRVESIHVEDGAFVEANDLLVELSNTSLQLEVIAREAEVTEQLNNLNTIQLQLEQNRLDHKRNLVEIDWQITKLTRDVARKRELAQKGHVSDQDLELAEDELTYWTRRREVTLEAQETDERLQKAQMVQLEDSARQLQNNLALARKNLDSLNVRAPVAGLLTAFDAEVGQSLARGERVGQIDDPDQFKLVALIDEFYLPRVDIGQTAIVDVSSRRYDLAIAKIYPQVTNGQFEVDMTFAQGMPGDIRRGQTLQSRLSLGDPSQAVLIPNGAFYQDTGGNWVFVVAPDRSVAVKRPVHLGRRNARFIEVVDGLEPGEHIITSPYTGFLEMDRLELDA